MRAETIFEQLFFVTAHLTGKDGNSGSWTGTGFIVTFKTSAGEVPLMITNKHVLEGATELTIQLVKAAGDGTPDTAATSTVLTEFGPDAWMGHPDADIDVAALFVGPVVNQMREEGREAFYRQIDSALLLTQEQVADLDALEQVVFIGYPSGIFDSVSFLPIARRGQTATPMENDYQGKAAFLIDASVFPGSSGSPVFIADTGVRIDRGGTIQLEGRRRLHLVGVLAAVHMRQVGGAVVDIPTKQIAVFDEPIDLGIVFKASTIQTTAELLFERIGINIVDSETTELA